MRYMDLFVRDHPNLDLERAVDCNCPSDFGYQMGEELCMTPNGDPAPASCRACWEQEAEEEDSPSSAPSGHLPPLGEGLSFEQEAELTGTDMGGGIRWDDAGNVIDWGIVGPPGEVGRSVADEY